jgi:Ca2+-binding RTX toxin-like protein
MAHDLVARGEGASLLDLLADAAAASATTILSDLDDYLDSLAAALPQGEAAPDAPVEAGTETAALDADLDIAAERTYAALAGAVQGAAHGALATGEDHTAAPVLAGLRFSTALTDPAVLFGAARALPAVDNAVADGAGGGEAGDPVQTGVALSTNFWVRGLAGTARWSEGPPPILSYALSNGTQSDYDYFTSNTATLGGYAHSQANHANLNTGGGNAGAMRADIFTSELVMENVANVTLNYFSGASDFQSSTVDFRFMSFNNLSGLNGVATFPGTDPSSDDYEAFILYNNNNSSMSQTPELGGTVNRIHTVLHEWLHSMGLGHPHDTGTGTTSWGGDELDNDRYTVMSYNRGGLGVNNQTLTYGYATTPMALDVAALHWLYGSVANHTGNTVYTLTDPGTVALDIDGDDGTVSIGRAFYAIWDTGGIDEIRYSGTKAVVINLNAATMSTSVSADLNQIIGDLTGDAYYDTILPAGTAGETRNDQTNSQYFAGGFFSRVISATSGAPDLGGYSIASSIHATGGQTTVIENATGSGSDDILIGNTAANTLTGNAGADLMIGGDGNDSALGGSGEDHLYGGDGNDVLDGGLDVDLVYGGVGNDRIVVTSFNFIDDAYGGSGDDTLDLSGHGRAMIVNLDTGLYQTDLNAEGPQTVSSIEIVSGTGNDDVITGTYSTQTLIGNAGNDTFISLVGRFYDAIYGGAGTDTLDHSASDYSGDTFDFQTGILTNAGGHINPTSVALSSIEIYHDGSGANTIISAGSGQTLYGNGGDDTMIATSGAETMYGGTGQDIVDLSVGNFIYTFDTQTGLATQYPSELFLGFEHFIFGSSDDQISTQTIANRAETIIAGAGNDIITDRTNMAAGDLDVYDGGAGNDTLIHDLTWSSGVTFNLTSGFVTVGGSNRDQLISIENLVIGGAASVFGSTADNVITVNGSGSNSINAGSGNDVVYAGSGNDTIIDTQTFLAGEEDTYNGGDGIDTLVHDFSWVSSVTFDLAAGQSSFGAVIDTLISIENLVIGGSASVLGSAGANVITVNGFGANIINTGAGGDTVYSGGGDDSVRGGNGVDSLYGGEGNDTLTGLAGFDHFEGGTGDDTYFSNSSADTILELSGGGIDKIFSPVSVNLMAMSTEVENVTLQGTLDRNITGNNLDNTLVGNWGHNIINGGNGDDFINGGDGNDTLNGSNNNDVLIGGAGDDELIGGAGDDTMNGQAGSDVFIFAGAFGTDRINGFSVVDAVEAIDLSAIATITGFADLQANHLTQTVNGALITAGGHSVLLAGILAVDLTVNEFIF